MPAMNDESRSNELAELEQREERADARAATRKIASAPVGDVTGGERERSSRGILPGRAGDHARSDDRVVVVEHRDLTGRDRRRPARRARARSRRPWPRRPRGDGRGAVAELGLGALDRRRRGARAPRRASRASARARPDDERVRRRVGAQRVQRLGRREPEPAPLSGREAPEAVVAAEPRPSSSTIAPRPRRARAARGTRGSRRRRGSTPPGSRRARRRRARRPRPRRATSASSASPSGNPTRSSRARIDGREHVRLVLARRRLRARRAAARRARRFARSGRSRGRRHRRARRTRPARRSGSAPLHRMHGFGVSPSRSPSTNGSHDGVPERLAQVERDVRDARARGRSRARAITASGEQQARSALGPGRVEPEAERDADRVGAARSSATALSTPPLIATATRPGVGRGPERRARARSRARRRRASRREPRQPRAGSGRRAAAPCPGASASTIRSPSTTQPGERVSSPRAESPISSTAIEPG